MKLNEHPNFRIAINRLHPTHVRRIRRRALRLYLWAALGIAMWCYMAWRFKAI